MNAREEIPITEEVMRYAREHMERDRPWIHGKPVKAYQEKDGRISITYLPGYCGRSGLGMKRSAYTGRQSLSAHTQIHN